MNKCELTAHSVVLENPLEVIYGPFGIIFGCISFERKVRETTVLVFIRE